MLCGILAVGLILFRVVSILSTPVRCMQMTGRMKIDPKEPTGILLEQYTYAQFLILMVIKDHCHTKLFDMLLTQLAKNVASTRNIDCFENRHTVDMYDIEEGSRFDGRSMAASTTDETFVSKQFEDDQSSIFKFDGKDGSSLSSFETNDYHVLKSKKIPEIGNELGSMPSLSEDVENRKLYPEKNSSGWQNWDKASYYKPKGLERVDSITSVERSSFLEFQNLRDDISRQTNDDKENLV